MNKPENEYKRLTPEQIAAIATPYYGPRFWNQLREDMGGFSNAAPAKWRKNGFTGTTLTAFLDAMKRKQEESKSARAKSDKLIRAVLKARADAGVMTPPREDQDGQKG